MLRRDCKDSIVVDRRGLRKHALDEVQRTPSLEEETATLEEHARAQDTQPAESGRLCVERPRFILSAPSAG